MNDLKFKTRETATHDVTESISMFARRLKL